ncbi:MAG: S26 family signal peptidase [Actinobacteria bacterium]|nr:MAG: S26 family signal peptidase [Actinomycetota bacterium]
MEPALLDGQGLITVAAGRPRVGQIRCFEHPSRAGFWLVKRVDAVHDNGTITVLSDNRTSTLADSRTFGPVPVAGSYRVLLRVPRRQT